MHNSCSPEMAKISGHATQLTALGNELMLKAKASKNPEQMLVGAELMESAMTLTMNHHKTETRRIIKRYGADGTLATEDHSSHHE
jgi:hypothetical protein